MTYVPGKSPHKGIKGCIVAAAGPLGNYGMVLFLSQSFMQNWMQAETIKQAIVINLGMMLLNLLPALPLGASNFPGMKFASFGFVKISEKRNFSGIFYRVYLKTGNMTNSEGFSA